MRTRGLLFSTSTGAQLLQTNALRDSLHPTLEGLEHVKGGFNIFHRFRMPGSTPALLVLAETRIRALHQTP